jgi:isoquinoline 1-oxidoreductase subunit alpha
MYPCPSQIFASVLSTAGGQVFVGGINDRMFRAFDAMTGELLWQQRTNSGIVAMSVAYQVGDTEYVAVQSGRGVHAQRIQQGLSTTQLKLDPSEVPQGGVIFAATPLSLQGSEGGRAASPPRRENNMANIHVNLQDYTYDGDPSVPLLWVLRDELGLTGTKFGCGGGFCGSCTVHLDGVAIRSCQVAVGDVAGRKVVTIEGLDPHGEHPVQRAWRETSAPQCGYCHAGQIMQAAALLAINPKPSQDDITAAMAGNICRCGCYQRIVDAVHLAATGV